MELFMFGIFIALVIISVSTESFYILNYLD